MNIEKQFKWKFTEFGVNIYKKKIEETQNCASIYELRGKDLGL